MDHPNKRAKLQCNKNFEHLIKGNFNQSDETIFVNVKSRNRQCTANSVVFLVFCEIIDKWNPIDIDNILIIGDFVYTISARNEDRYGKYLSADHIVENICIPACGFVKNAT